MSSSSEKKKNWKHLELVLAIIICIVFLGLLTTPVAFGYYFKDKFLPNTVVAGVSVSNMTLPQATQTLENKFGKIEDKKITLNLADQKFPLELKDLGVTMEWETYLARTYESQHHGKLSEDTINVSKSWLGRKDNKITVPLKIEKNKINTELDTILAKVNKNPTDAFIKIANNQVVIDKETYGVGVDKDLLENLIYKNLTQKAAQGDWTNLDLTFQAMTLQPKLTESSLTPVKIKAENMTKNPIELTYDNQKYTARQIDMINWIRFDNKDNVVTPVFDKAQIDRYVTGIAKKVDIIPVTKVISSTDGSTMQEGKDGRALAKAKLSSDILSSLNSQPASSTTADQIQMASAAPVTLAIAMQVDPKPFATQTAAPAFTPGMYPGKYIEVNLTQQRMYLWEGQNNVAQYRVSSGKKSTPTREGTFTIRNKAQVGKSFPWIMPWWMAFAQDKTGAWQGIHELPVDMRTGRKEGIQDIGIAVSHGCVRLAVGEAKAVYDWAEVGIPMYVHK